METKIKSYPCESVLVQKGLSKLSVPARLAEDLKSRHRAWTEFKDAVLSNDSGGGYTVGLYQNRSRLQAIASANGLICIPEGTESLSRGDIPPVQVLISRLDMI